MCVYSFRCFGLDFCVSWIIYVIFCCCFYGFGDGGFKNWVDDWSNFVVDDFGGCNIWWCNCIRFFIGSDYGDSVCDIFRKGGRIWNWCGGVDWFVVDVIGYFRMYDEYIFLI